MRFSVFSRRSAFSVLIDDSKGFKSNWLMQGGHGSANVSTNVIRLVLGVPFVRGLLRIRDVLFIVRPVL